MATKIANTYFFTLDSINAGGGGGGGGGSQSAVLYTPQSLQDSQKAQARQNIGAGTYTKPDTGIPDTDLSDSVRDILSTSITYTDLEGTAEEWEFTMADGSTVIKRPVILPNEA